ncbi:hypothetical protein PUNSTDRAFT_116663 [Punctularia strigosozonata HHB-11173 SS5]|uniref:Acid protease n=1 Tax=Punctularia strigosozonata (strain HHB-11173) TaxID=741275 RepID=R7S368_PUNST|nr:uncharacterized protein PUNSTDRAFT_116663 [Punctularia strigosozonata HHB-11173 SS5]EIN04217.1 hypothetical protein PUNSTDRAFT_116663 [Punctularia strigosozonata HHB-11173 SS5]
MKGLFSIVSAALFATAVIAVAPPAELGPLDGLVDGALGEITNILDVRDDLHFNPVDIELKTLATGEISPRYMTNAKRMARGLNPKAPVNLRDLPTSTVSATLPKRSTAPNLNSRSYTGTVSVVSNDNSSVIGYVSASPNKYGQYGLCTDVDAALKVSFTVSDDSSPFDITASNGISDFPFFGAIVGHASKAVDLVSGALNYVALGGVEQCGLGAIPSIISNAFSFITGISVAVESAIWSISDDLELSLGWVNSDGSKPESTDLVYVSTEDALVLTGDLPVFRNSFGFSADVSVSCSLKLVVS